MRVVSVSLWIPLLVFLIAPLGFVARRRVRGYVRRKRGLCAGGLKARLKPALSVLTGPPEVSCARPAKARPATIDKPVDLRCNTGFE